jgi:hypothetical protein
VSRSFSSYVEAEFPLSFLLWPVIGHCPVAFGSISDPDTLFAEDSFCVPSVPRSRKQSFSLQILHQSFEYFFHLSIRAVFLNYFMLFDFITLTVLRKECTDYENSKC